MQKPIVFISHISEEKEIAAALKELVESAFLNMMDVFVSSDPSSIGLGQKWLDSITDALESCVVEVILASPMSIQRPWINFEAGAGWIRKIRVIPICHSGMTPDKLPMPLKLLQAATATEETQLRMILPALARSLDCDLPTIDLSPFIETVKEFEETSKANAAVLSKLPTPTRDGLAPHEMMALLAVANSVYTPLDAVSARVVRDEMTTYGYQPFLVNLGLKMLERKDLLTMYEARNSYRGDEDTEIVLTDAGWHWLSENREAVIAGVPAKKPTTAPAPPPDDEIPF